MFDIFGKFGSVEEINITARGLLEENDIDNLTILAKENGLEDNLPLFRSRDLEELTDSFMAALGRLRVEEQSEDIKKSNREIPATPIVEYLLSQCERVDIATAVLSTEKSLTKCIEYVKEKAKALVTRETPWLSDLTVFNLAMDYYTK